MDSKFGTIYLNHSWPFASFSDFLYQEPTSHEASRFRSLMKILSSLQVSTRIEAVHISHWHPSHLEWWVFLSTILDVMIELWHNPDYRTFPLEWTWKQNRSFRSFDTFLNQCLRSFQMEEMRMIFLLLTVTHFLSIDQLDQFALHTSVSLRVDHWNLFLPIVFSLPNLFVSILLSLFQHLSHPPFLDRPWNSNETWEMIHKVFQSLRPIPWYFLDQSPCLLVQPWIGKKMVRMCFRKNGMVKTAEKRRNLFARRERMDPKRKQRKLSHLVIIFLDRFQRTITKVSMTEDSRRLLHITTPALTFVTLPVPFEWSKLELVKKLHSEFFSVWPRVPEHFHDQLLFETPVERMGRKENACLKECISIPDSLEFSSWQRKSVCFGNPEIECKAQQQKAGNVIQAAVTFSFLDRQRLLRERGRDYWERERERERLLSHKDEIRSSHWKGSSCISFLNNLNLCSCVYQLNENILFPREMFQSSSVENQTRIEIKGYES